jgi:hypothetical protein
VKYLEDGDWQAAHEIVHIMEGDLPNARYWYGLAKRTFPAEPTAKAEISALREELRP